MSQMAEQKGFLPHLINGTCRHPASLQWAKGHTVNSYSFSVYFMAPLKTTVANCVDGSLAWGPRTVIKLLASCSIQNDMLVLHFFCWAAMEEPRFDWYAWLEPKNDCAALSRRSLSAHIPRAVQDAIVWSPKIASMHIQAISTWQYEN